MNQTITLGIWDGHDAGAALLKGGEILFAVQEERLSRRKLEVDFPRLAIAQCLTPAGLAPDRVDRIAVSTSDPAKTLTRLFPGLKEEYYLLRRRKKNPGRLDPIKKKFKYYFTEFGPNAISRTLSRVCLGRELQAMGFDPGRLALFDHHYCHAQTAARCSGFSHCTVLTLDGLGDGLAGSIYHFADGVLTRVHGLPATRSLGIFFEHVTNLMNMRELEDEGKVMALANYAYPISDAENPFLKLIRVEGLEIVNPLRANGLYRALKKILWRYPSEQFAYMAQRALEINVLALAMAACRTVGSGNIALAGGVFSNIKLNMQIAELPEVDRIYVFPNMGDGGLALGAALAGAEVDGPASYPLPDLSLGPGYSRDEIVAALAGSEFHYRELADPSAEAARLLLAGEIILWFRGRLEYGPRSLGNRSILARPDDVAIKDQLNLLQKKRVWYQPFCPSLLWEDAPAILKVEGRNDLEQNRFMTTAFQVRSEYRALMAGVINIDNTCRPQLVRDENPSFRQLLLLLKEQLGRGVVLNTSCNIHGEPVVCSPADALAMLGRTGLRALILEDFLVTKD